MISISYIREVGLLKWATRYFLLLFRKRVLLLDSSLRLPTGSKVHLPRQSRSATEVYVTNADIDWGSEALFARFSDKKRDFLDIGAHIGYYSAYLSPCVRKVYAFEPDRRNLPGLRVNAALAGNIEIEEVAVSSRDGHASLHVGQGSAVSSLDGSNTKDEVEVTVVTVDSFAAARPEIDVGLVKTDIEGHDLQALIGMANTVVRFQPLILTECIETLEIEQLCKQWNYSTFAYLRRPKVQGNFLTKLSGSSLHDRKYKMLFLVPQRLRNSFQLLTDTK